VIYLLKIRYFTLAFSHNKGLATCIDTLSRGLLVDKDDRYKHGGITFETEPIECTLEALPTHNIVRGGKRANVVSPDAVLPPVSGLIPDFESLARERALNRDLAIKVLRGGSPLILGE
jgi:hypothetical protein